MSVIVSGLARAALLDISDWIRRDNPARAASFVEELYQACHALGTFPEACPLAPEFGNGIRKKTHGNYLILYRVSSTVRIVSIVHAARRRDPPAPR